MDSFNLIEQAFKQQFPNGFFSLRKSNSLGEYITIHLGLVADLNDVTNKIRQNDPMSHVFVIHFEKDGTYTADLATGGLMVNPLEKYLAMSRVKTKWRKVSGNEAKIVKAFTNWVVKLRAIVDDNKQDIYNAANYQKYL